MNKKALLDYALFARKELETQIALSLNKLGIYKGRILKANVVGDFTIIEGNPDSFPKRVYNLRKQMISEYFEGEEKFETIVEEFAYTWFNRLVAIRFMEVHDYFPHGFRVLSSRDGSYEPEILSNLPYVKEELDLDEEIVRSLRDQNKTEDLFRYVLVQQCAALSKIIPDIFDVREKYLELLLPSNLLSQDSVIRKIEMIPEEDFMNDIEVVGWLYQFYNSVKKDEVYASKETITKDTLPAVSQLFTPDWIVRYMADNSVGRLWLESYPNSSLKAELKYYVDDAKQDEETQKKLDEIKYKNVDPEEIKIIEPCCGSGHILVYVFDLLLKMYLEQGYNKSDIPALILKNNLYGLDVDKRAAQLAKFSLIMKARSIDKRFFNEDRFVNPRVYEIKDSQLLIALNYKDAMKSLHFSAKSIELAEYLVDTFKYGKVIGSLLKIKQKDYTDLINDINRCKNIESPGLFEQDFYAKGIKRLVYLSVISNLIAQKYDVMITNPPYVSFDKMPKEVKEYVTDYFYTGRYDMYSSFILKKDDFVKKNGFAAFITMHNYMFAPSFDEFRSELLKKNIISLLHLGTRAFEEISGEIVQTSSVIFRNSSIEGTMSSTINVSDENNSAKKSVVFFDINNRRYFSFDKCKGLPNGIFAYSLEQEIIELYNNSPKISDYSVSKAGVVTGDDEYFINLWFEVDYRDISFVPKKPYGKYHLFTKGGQFEKWYGANIDYVLKLADLYNPNKTNKSVRRGDPDYYFKLGIGWSQVAGGTNKNFSLFSDCLCKTTTPSIYVNDYRYFNYILGVLNSSITPFIIKKTNPTLSILTSDIANLPIVIDSESFDFVSSEVEDCISIRKELMKQNESSYLFKHTSYFYLSNKKIEDAFIEIKNNNLKILETLSGKERALDKKIIQIYGLEKLITSKDNTYLVDDKKEYSKKLISFFIGILMGRYSLTCEDLVYAGGPFDRKEFANYVDEDGILPIYQFIGIDDGLTKSICDIVKHVYGDTYYRENLDFIADSLGRKADEGAEEAINRYLNNDFYKDHLKTYQNRPIYWMFNSGKLGAFKCLVYLHRYDKNTLAKINAKYFLPRTALYKSEYERLNDQLTRADLAQKKKIEAQLKKIEEAQEELQLYGQILDHMANQFIDIDLDDGVKVNYVKFQGISLEVNGATIKKDLLVPFGLEKKK